MNKSGDLSLHYLARQAKQRLRTSATKEENSFECICQINNDAYEELLYDRFVVLFNSQEEILNPLDRLIDHRIFDKCDDVGKQRCILEASKTYIRLKDKFNQINSRKIG